MQQIGKQLDFTLNDNLCHQLKRHKSKSVLEKPTSTENKQDVKVDQFLFGESKKDLSKYLCSSSRKSISTLSNGTVITNKLSQNQI